MADRIKINYAELGTLADTSGQVVADLDAVERPNDVDFSHSPCVAHGFREFDQAWDKRRGELTEALGIVTEALAGIAQIFEDAETQMVAELEGGGD